MSLTKFSLARTILANGDEKIANLFLQCSNKERCLPGVLISQRRELECNRCCLESSSHRRTKTSAEQENKIKKLISLQRTGKDDQLKVIMAEGDRSRSIVYRISILFSPSHHIVLANYRRWQMLLFYFFPMVKNILIEELLFKHYMNINQSTHISLRSV